MSNKFGNTKRVQNQMCVLSTVPYTCFMFFIINNIHTYNSERLFMLPIQIRFNEMLSCVLTAHQKQTIYHCIRMPSGSMQQHPLMCNLPLYFMCFCLQTNHFSFASPVDGR